MKVLIPTQLQKVTSTPELTIHGMIVKDVLDKMVSEFPLLKDRLYNSGGVLNKFINIYVNDEDIRFLNDENTPVGDNDVLSIIPSVAGG